MLQKIIRRRGVAVAVLVNEHGVETRTFPQSMSDDAIMAAVAPKPETAKKTSAKKTNASPKKGAATKETGKNA